MIVRIYRRIRCEIVQNGKFSESLEKQVDLCYNQTAGNVFGNLIQTTGEPLTIKDIARLAGCGVSTVSRALNGSNEISEQTKERINEVIRKYNYTPNGNARRMRRSAEKTILLIVNGSSNLFFSPLIEQIQIAASSAGFQIAVNHIDEQEDEVQFASRLCTELRPAGVIFLGGDMRNFKRSFARIKLPCILSTANAEELGFETFPPSVLTTMAAAGRRQNSCSTVVTKKSGYSAATSAPTVLRDCVTAVFAVYALSVVRIFPTASFVHIRSVLLMRRQWLFITSARI